MEASTCRKLLADSRPKPTAGVEDSMHGEIEAFIRHLYRTLQFDVMRKPMLITPDDVVAISNRTTPDRYFSRPLNDTQVTGPACVRGAMVVSDIAFVPRAKINSHATASSGTHELDSMRQREAQLRSSKEFDALLGERLYAELTSAYEKNLRSKMYSRCLQCDSTVSGRLYSPAVDPPCRKCTTSILDRNTIACNKASNAARIQEYVDIFKEREFTGREYFECSKQQFCPKYSD